MTKSKDVTDDQIKAFSKEAQEHGDTDAVKVCQKALKGNKVARVTVAKMIDNAKAQED